MNNVYYAMFMPVFWALYKPNVLISTPAFQMQVQKKLYFRPTTSEVNSFFKEMENVGYGEFLIHNDKNVTRYETRAFKCVVKVPSHTTVETIIKCKRVTK